MPKTPQFHSETPLEGRSVSNASINDALIRDSIIPRNGKAANGSLEWTVTRSHSTKTRPLNLSPRARIPNCISSPFQVSSTECNPSATYFARKTPEKCLRRAIASGFCNACTTVTCIFAIGSPIHPHISATIRRAAKPRRRQATTIIKLLTRTAAHRRVLPIKSNPE